MNADAKKPAVPGRMRINVPADLDPVYANLALITNSQSEIIIDFAQMMPQMPEARVRARIVLTPFNAKLVLRALNEHMGRFEAQYGEIELPEKNPSLAEQLFRPAADDPPAETPSAENPPAENPPAEE